MAYTAGRCHSCMSLVFFIFWIYILQYCENQQKNFDMENFPYTLRVESFAGRKFRDFASFLVARESLYSWNRSEKGVRESLSPQNDTFKGLHEISTEKLLKWDHNKKIWQKFAVFAKVYTHKIHLTTQSRKFIPAKLNFHLWRSRKFIHAKLTTRETFYP